MAIANLTLSKLSHVAWGSTYRWAFSFPMNTPSGSFSEFIPAQALELSHIIANDREIEIGTNSYKIPSSQSARQCSITMYDDELDTMLDYFESWLTDMHPKTGGIATLEESARIMEYTRTDRRNNVTRQYHCLCYPTGELTSQSNSDNAARIVSVTLNLLQITITPYKPAKAQVANALIV